MKHTLYKLMILALVIVNLTSCESYLEEEPKSLLTAKYLETSNGVNAALNSAYSDLRYFYANESGMNATCSGTDEWQKGPDGNANFNTYTASMGADGAISGVWNWGYTAINTSNAVIKYAPISGMDEAEWKRVVAEAKYLRATWYFIIVQTFGDCPLNLEFISVPTTEAHKDIAANVYNAIISDLEEAKTILPTNATEMGRVDAAAVQHLLSKVYLTRATASHSPDKNDDYQKAYENAMELIDNASDYGLALLKDYADIHRPRNEHNSEAIFTVERNTDILYNNGGNPSGGVLDYKRNMAAMLFRPNYSAWVSGLVRDIPYGRPWHRIRPTNYVLDVVFAERSDDTRYNKTFQTVWLVNDAANVEDKTFRAGDTAAWLPGVENPRAVKALRIYKPSQYYGNNGQTASIYPSLSKFDDIDRPDIAEASVRPFIVHRFAETYLIAAEAAMYVGNASKAVELINVVRARAAYNSNRTDGENVLAVQRTLNKTPDMTDFNIGINFILDERSRELCGEYMRWWDLARTRTTTGEVQLLYRINNLNPAVPATGAVKEFHVVRPYPQSQIDLTSNTFTQNLGY